MYQTLNKRLFKVMTENQRLFSLIRRCVSGVGREMGSAIASH